MDTRQAKALDKFYTDPVEALQALHTLAYACAQMGLDPARLAAVEPSAGAGAFLVPSPPFGEGLHAFDIAPEHPSVAQADFLALDTLAALRRAKDRTVFVGNPPFGKRGRLAVAFLNKALAEGAVVGFVLPILFRKWITQRTVRADAHLLADIDIPPTAFTLNGAPALVRCCFQIWTTRDPALAGWQDLRLRDAPPRHHPDFDLWQYNATPVAAKYFAYPWDFAVLRQGYGDYTTLHTDPTALSRKKQWMFVKAHSPEALARLRAIDFEALAATNTSTKGFGKTELVQRYTALYGDGHKPSQSEAIRRGNLSPATG